MNAETLSGLAAKRIALWAYCEACHRNKVLDPAGVIAAQGDGPVPAAGARWRCSCGHRPVFTRPHWPYVSAFDRQKYLPSALDKYTYSVYIQMDGGIGPPEKVTDLGDFKCKTATQPCWKT